LSTDAGARRQANPAVLIPRRAAELKRLSDRLDHLWDEERTLKAALRFGDRDHIVARARVEERLERAA